MGLFVPGFSLHSNVTYVANVVLKIVLLRSERAEAKNASGVFNTGQWTGKN
jgi:hypothetical protein